MPLNAAGEEEKEKVGGEKEKGGGEIVQQVMYVCLQFQRCRKT